MKRQTLVVMKPLALALLAALSGATQANTPAAIDVSPNAAATLAQPQATPSAMYAQDIGDNTFQSTNLQLLSNGYTVESGALIGASGESGALVLVRSPQGSLTAFIDLDEKKGLLQVTADGQRSFEPDTGADFKQDDMVKKAEIAAQEAAASSTDGASETRYINVLAGYTQAALDARKVDPIAFAIGQLELVNLSLRNSDVRNLQLRLAGIRVVDESIPVSAQGLERWFSELTMRSPQYNAGLSVGFSVGGHSWGNAHFPGQTSVVSINSSTAFRHVVGHNLGGSHCFPEGGRHHKHGYDAGGGFTTILCGNGKAYYSTPDVTVDGKSIGNPGTANMARLWREEARRLSGSFPNLLGPSMIVVSPQNAAVLRLPARMSGVVANNADAGPTRLEYNNSTEPTLLTVQMTAQNGKTYPVRVRASRQIAGCPTPTPMNSYTVCHPWSLGGEMTLSLSISALDNTRLPFGWLNGTLRLNQQTYNQELPSQPILVSLSYRRNH